MSHPRTDPGRHRRLAERTLDIESRALQAVKGLLDADFDRAVELMLACRGRVVVAGMGKSGHVGRKIAATLASTGTPALFMHPAEASHGDLGVITPADVFLALSNSGESDELNLILPVIKRMGVPMIAITGRRDSSLARQSDAVVCSAVAEEACPLNLAPTASTTAQMALGNALAVALLDARGFQPEDFARSHLGGEILGHLRRPPAHPRVFQGRPDGDDATKAAQAKPLWVYVTTIGELNAIETWLRELLVRLGVPPLVLLTSHAHYAEAYQRKFPQASVVAFDGSVAQAEDLGRTVAPCMLVIAEIPCLRHDATCRFSYATLRAVRRAGAPVVLVNGWLYGDHPASRMDWLEKRLFARDYVRGIDLALVQTPEVKAGMIEAGDWPECVFVTGNLKYNAMRERALRRPETPLAQALLDYRAGPVVVAGSVTETSDQRGILRAFSELLQTRLQARLVLAPRHPENTERMAALASLLQESGLAHQYRSRIAADAAMHHPVRILDTMGELGDCYAAATFAYVGTDHNVLEPLAHARLVYVSGDWQPMYPSYPVYLQTLAIGLVAQVSSMADLGRLWSTAAEDLDAALDAQRARVEGLLASGRRPGAEQPRSAVSPPGHADTGMTRGEARHPEGCGQCG